MSVLLDSAVMYLGHLEEDLGTFIFCMDWIKGPDEGI